MSFLEILFELLNGVLPNKVTYGTNNIDDNDLDIYPFIVYQEISNRVSVYSDNKPAVRITTYQISLVTENKNTDVEHSLESSLSQVGINYQMITEYVNEDNSVNRVYEVKMEEIKHE